MAGLRSCRQNRKGVWMEIVFWGLTRQRSRAWKSEQAEEWVKAGRAERASGHRKNRVSGQQVTRRRLTLAWSWSVIYHWRWQNNLVTSGRKARVDMLQGLIAEWWSGVPAAKLWWWKEGPRPGRQTAIDGQGKNQEETKGRGEHTETQGNWRRGDDHNTKYCRIQLPNAVCCALCTWWVLEY